MRTLADVCDPAGIGSMAHLELFDLGPFQPDGPAKMKAMLDPVIRRLRAVGFSYFNFDLQDKSDVLIPAMAKFMSKNYPDMAHGATAIGISVKYGIPHDDPNRTERARLLAAVFHAQRGTKATLAGCYGLPQGPDPTRDFYDHGVAQALSQVRRGNG